jgi:hypothetical protein
MSPHLSNLEGTFNSNHVKNSQISGLGKQPLTPLIFKVSQSVAPLQFIYMEVNLWPNNMG